jgi:FAD/FMN-containing dehydrogenase
MIDLSLMRDVVVDTDARTARAGPGATWADYNDATHAHGLATTGGIVSTTGVAGLTLGGGLGWLMGAQGLAVDNLLSVELVTADGDVVTADANHEPDLFWALRGGGGNFGVATSLQFRTHPLETVFGGLLLYPIESAAEVADHYRTAIKGAADEFRADFGLAHGPDGSKLAAVLVCHCGEMAEAEADLAVLRELTPAADSVSPIPYPAMNTLLDPMFPKGALNYWKSAFFTELSDAAMRTMVDAFEAAPSPMCGMQAELFHGAVTRIDAEATAVPHREPGFNLILVAQWMDPAETGAHISWAKEAFEALRPYMADRRYVNYLAADDGGFVRQAYGPNYDRLVQVKRRFDPDNVFHLNFNIEPT